MKSGEWVKGGIWKEREVGFGVWGWGVDMGLEVEGRGRGLGVEGGEWGVGVGGRCGRWGVGEGGGESGGWGVRMWVLEGGHTEGEDRGPKERKKE